MARSEQQGTACSPSCQPSQIGHLLARELTEHQVATAPPSEKSPEWPDDRTERLIDLWLHTAMTREAIAEELGVSTYAVIGKTGRLKASGVLPAGARPLARPLKERRAPAARGPAALPSLQCLAAPLPAPARQAIMPKRVAVVRTVTVAPRPLTEQCCWPTTDRRPWRFCDEPCSGNYCAEHARLARPARVERSERSAQA